MMHGSSHHRHQSDALENDRRQRAGDRDSLNDFSATKKQTLTAVLHGIDRVVERCLVEVEFSDP